MEVVMRRMAAIVAVLALGCAAGPEAAWEGEYYGSLECVGVDIDGEPYSELSAQTIAFGPADGGGLYMLGRGCSVPIVVESASYASIPAYECESALPDGRPVRVIYETGGANLDGMDLAMSWRGAVIYDGAVAARWAIYVTCTFDGWQAD